MGDRMDIPLPSSVYELNIVLVGTSHPGNLGAICRTMLNHGFTNLRLVNPQCSVDDEEARNRAKHAGSILDSTEVFTDFESAVSDCSLVVGTSGKREVGSKILFRHFVLPWEFSDKIRDFEGKVALVFGEEGKGLSTEDLEKCDYLLTLPTWEGYPIANLSQAVGHCVYELHRDRVISGTKVHGVKKERVITPELRVILKQAIEEFANSLPGDEIRSSQISDVLERVVLRGMPLDVEAQRLLSAFVDSTTALQKLNNDEDWLRNRRKRVTPSNSPKTSESL